MRLCAPSAAIRYWARTGASTPVARSIRLALTPDGPWLSADNAASKRSPAGPWDFRNAAQHGLQIILGAEAVRHGRHGEVPGRRAPGHAALDLLAGQGFGPDDEAGALGGQAGLADGLLDAALT